VSRHGGIAVAVGALAGKIDQQLADRHNIQHTFASFKDNRRPPQYGFRRSVFYVDN
jgi:hypothetical protein